MAPAQCKAYGEYISKNTEICPHYGEAGIEAMSHDDYNMELIDAAGNGDTETVALLLEKGADVDATDDFGTTALIRAADEGHTGSVALLLDRGADVNTTTDSGMTALIRAAEEGHTDTVVVLLEKGADVDIRVGCKKRTHRDRSTIAR